MDKKRLNIEQGKELERIRGKAHKSELAEFLGLSDRTVARYENGERTINIGHLRLIRSDQWTKWITNKGHHATVNEPNGRYILHGDPPNISWEEFCGVPLGLGFDKAVDLLADVFRPGDKILIDEAVSVLNRLAKNIEMQNQFNALKTEMNQIKNVQPDRRHGKNRRQIVTPDFPLDKEQRSGLDRRNQ